MPIPHPPPCAAEMGPHPAHGAWDYYRRRIWAPRRLALFALVIGLGAAAGLARTALPALLLARWAPPTACSVTSPYARTVAPKTSRGLAPTPPISGMNAVARAAVALRYL